MKIICIGRNYAEHARELKNDVPTEPVIFMKAQNALLTPGKPFFYPEFTRDLHYECELVVKISKNGKHIQEKFASRYFSEITLGIDFTARDIQQKLKDKGLPWELAKAFDSSAAIGTFTSLQDQDIQSLNFELKKNGKAVQQGNTGNMIFNVSQIITFVSQYFTLNTGDLLFTGTPAGVGPVSIGDHLEGFLGDESLLDVAIR